MSSILRTGRQKFGGLDHVAALQNPEQLLAELVTVVKTDKSGLIKYSCFKFSLCKVSLHRFNF